MGSQQINFKGLTVNHLSFSLCLLFKRVFKRWSHSKLFLCFKGKYTNIDYLTYETYKLNIEGGHTANNLVLV